MSEPQNIAGTTSNKYHWWYDANKAGVRNPPPTNMSGSPPISPGAETGGRKFSLTSMLIGSPDSVSTSPTYNPARRDSLKNMYHVMSDFGTPDN